MTGSVRAGTHSESRRVNVVDMSDVPAVCASNLHSFLVVLGDVCILMKTKHLRIRVERQSSNVVDVRLVAAVRR